MKNSNKKYYSSYYLSAVNKLNSRQPLPSIVFTLNNILYSFNRTYKDTSI